MCPAQRVVDVDRGCVSVCTKELEALELQADVGSQVSVHFRHVLSAWNVRVVVETTLKLFFKLNPNFRFNHSTNCKKISCNMRHRVIVELLNCRHSKAKPRFND